MNNWKNRKINNLTDEYWKTLKHPHRKQIINVLKKLKPFNSVLEIGCGCGMNLYNINNKFKTELAGIDVNQEAIEFAIKKLPNAFLLTGSIEDIGYKNVNYDVVLCDATLMYVEDIERVMHKISRIANKAIILCEWYAEEDKFDGHRIRNYPERLKDWNVRMKDVIWPEDKNWQKYGKIIIATK